MEYQFPRDTCETVTPFSTPPIQPFSFFINIMSILVILFYMYISHDPYVRFLLFTFLLFQVWHAYSHCFHILDSTLQSNITHIALYIMAIASIIVIPYLDRTDSKSIFLQNKIHLFILLLLFLIDMWILLRVQGIWMIFSGLFVLSYVYIAQLHVFDPRVIKYLYVSFAFLGLTLMFEINEILNCESMQKHFSFPYHILIEISGLLAFAFLSHTFYAWNSLDRERKVSV